MLDSFSQKRRAPGTGKIPSARVPSSQELHGLGYFVAGLPFYFACLYTFNHKSLTQGRYGRGLPCKAAQERGKPARLAATGLCELPGSQTRGVDA